MKHLLLILALMVTPVHAQNSDRDPNELIWGTVEYLECGLERVVPPETLIGNYFMENGLEIFVYDTNGDGEFDVVLTLPQGDINRYPLFHTFDRDYDGQPDVQWEDTKRDGTCGPHLIPTIIKPPSKEA